MQPPTVLIVPGLRDAVAQHWQTLLEARLRDEGWPVASVPPLGRDDLDCARRVAALARAAQSIDGPIVVVAHSGGCITVAHWAADAPPRVRGVLLAVPPDFERPMPDGYPALQALSDAGWLPVPRAPLPFPAIVAASSNDPLGSFERIAVLASDWGAKLVALGAVGHLNPASGFGAWPLAETFIRALAAPPGTCPLPEAA